LDVNSTKTHAVLAGKEILKTVRFEDGSITEDVNLRFNINTVSEDIARKRRDFLPATDVKWSHGNFANFIATAANNGRIALYDVSRTEVERAWVHEHTGQVHKLAFDPHIGALLLSGSHDGTVKTWDLRTLARASQTLKSGGGFFPRKSGIRDVKWCPTRATDAIEFAVCTDVGVIQKWDLRKPNQPLLSINAHAGSACLSIDWHPDGKHLVSGGLDKFVKVWDFHSDKGNQKAKFELRTPQAIRNVRWRPPCWSSEFAGTGQWQCTQIATSYNQDDPRVHIWDLRRQHLPFRELERYRNPATDLLWANKDLIWTVGDEGWFTQTDVSFASLVHHSVPPGAVAWFPEGDYAAFAENLDVRRGSGMEDPAVGFLSVPHEKLSSGEEMVVTGSGSFSDDEAESILPNTFKRRQSRAASAKSGKSQTNTPPTGDGFLAVLSLEKSVPVGMFNNKQIGMMGQITGLTADPEVTQFLARSYARPISEAERTASPELILERLEVAFTLNADVCDEVSMHRTAQSWRMLGMVIIPELREWAKKNRAERLWELQKKEAPQLWEKEKYNENPAFHDKAPITRRSDEERVEKTQSNLFKGALGLARLGGVHDLDSTSNVTTPMARPLPDSPISDINSPRHHYRNLDETLEKLPQLPPSVLTSHSTAAAASKALRENAGSLLSRQLSPSTTSDSETSPSKPRHRRTESSQSLRSLQTLSPSTNRPGLQSALLSSPLALRPTSRLPPTQKQEDRRAALRDYQKQARPLLTFDDAPSSPAPSIIIPPQAFDDGDDHPTFPIFSASDSSEGGVIADGISNGRHTSAAQYQIQGLSRRLATGGGSTDGGTRSGARSRLTDKGGGAGQDYHEGAELGERGKGMDGGEGQGSQDERGAYDVNRSFDGNSSSDGFRFGMDGIAESREGPVKIIDRGTKGREDWKEEDATKELERQTAHVSISSSPHEPFEFDNESPVVKKVVSQSREYSINPFSGQEATTDDTKTGPSSSSHLSPGELSSNDFIFHDFRAIDITTYQPPTPFDWSALPLITQAIAFDLDTGPSCGQFSAHLLAHVHPYFFHHRYRRNPTTEILVEYQDYGLADRLMHPSLNSRIMEGIFAEHIQYLNRTGQHVQMAEFRKTCVDFDYPSLYTEDDSAIEAGLTTATPHALSIACANFDCQAPMGNGDVACQRCRRLRKVCPVCLSLKYQTEWHVISEELESSEEIESRLAYPPSTNDRSLWAFCSGCGHAAHLGCMEEWLSHPFSEGECPVMNCGHDCGPGAKRISRIKAAAAAEAEKQREKEKEKSKSVGIEGDRWKVTPSAAVERARKSLRSGDDRGTQSGDESGRVRSSFGARSGTSGTGTRKSVRLVTPREQGRE
jgi:WD40 repeat protein